MKPITPLNALHILIEGNKRFATHTPIHKDYKNQIIATSNSQHPIAIVFSCVDSRVPVELVFDVTLGDLFVTRIAGNVASLDALSSIEFACACGDAKLVVILGHEGCGAIQAACEDFKLGNITQLLKKIKPAIEIEKKRTSQTCDEAVFRSQVAHTNVELTKRYFYDHSAILRNLISQKKIAMISAMYDIRTGRVAFDIDPEHSLC